MLSLFYHGKSSLNHHFGNMLNLFFQQYKQILTQNSSSKIAQPECKMLVECVCLQVLPIHMCFPNAALCHKDASITVDATFSEVCGLSTLTKNNTELQYTTHDV